MVGEGGAVGDGRGKSVSKKPNGYEKNYELSFVVFLYILYIKLVGKPCEGCVVNCVGNLIEFNLGLFAAFHIF